MCQYRNVSQHDLAAHVFAVANKAYHAMIHEAKNQRFVISGESGAGKTVTANLVRIQHAFGILKKIHLIFI